MGDVCAWCAWCNSLFFSMSEGLRRSCVTPGRGVAAMQVEQRVRQAQGQREGQVQGQEQGQGQGQGQEQEQEQELSMSAAASWPAQDALAPCNGQVSIYICSILLLAVICIMLVLLMP